MKRFFGHFHDFSGQIHENLVLMLTIDLVQQLEHVESILSVSVPYETNMYSVRKIVWNCFRVRWFAEIAYTTHGSVVRYRNNSEIKPKVLH